MKNSICIALILCFFIKTNLSQEFKVYDLAIGSELKSVNTDKKIILFGLKYKCDKIKINNPLKGNSKLNVVHLLDYEHVVFNKINLLLGKKSDTINIASGLMILNGFKTINNDNYSLIVLINDNLYLFKESKNKGQSMIRPENASFLESVYFQVNNREYNVLELKKRFVKRSLKTM
jgi:hypothetical protein